MARLKARFFVVFHPQAPLITCGAPSAIYYNALIFIEFICHSRPMKVARQNHSVEMLKNTKKSLPTYAVAE